MAKRDKVNKLQALLIKPDYCDDTDILKDIDALDVYVLKDTLAYDGCLYIQPQYDKQPDWAAFVVPILDDELPCIRTKTSAAVLLIEACDRKFALTFGYGRNLLRPDSFERNFGLKVALNTIDPQDLRSVDTRTLEELTLNTRHQASRGTGLNTFGLDVSRDLLRLVTGTPSDKNLAKRITGADGVALTSRIRPEQLHDRCQQLLEAYSSTKYREQFGFIDNVANVRDPLLKNRLNDILFEHLNQRELTSLYLAPPEVLDWENVSGFCYSGRSAAALHDDLDIDDFMAECQDGQQYALSFLKNKRVGIRYETADTATMKWNAYSCIVFEVNVDGKHFVLTDGEWYEVENDFVSRVDSTINELAANALTLPDSEAGEHEEVYNSRIAANAGYLLLDRKCQKADNSSIEVCDLLTADRKFIHVKRKTRSSTLSHLFSQGTVSAETFLYEPEFRNNVRELVSLQANGAYADLIPEDRPQPSDYTVVYAIVAKDSAHWPLSLPFFSRLNLMNAANSLRRLGYNVSLTHVIER